MPEDISHAGHVGVDRILRPVPDSQDRREIAQRIRITAAGLARDRVSPIAQENNGETDAALATVAQEDAFIPAHGTFTKGLEHDEFGRVRLHHLAGFVTALNQTPPNSAQVQESPFPGVYKGPNAGRPAAFDAVLYNGNFTRPTGDTKARGWESPLAGHTFDLEGPDGDQVGMPPAPALGSDELAAELGEVYGGAILRDVPFSAWREAASEGGQHADAVAKMLNHLPYFKMAPGHDQAGRRRAARGELTGATLLRGSTTGAKAGPYISQFMLVGNGERPALGPDDPEADDSSGGKDSLNRAHCFIPPRMAEAMTDDTTPGKAEDGFIRYGIQTIPQQFAGHLACVDHMTDWGVWHDVQNGSNRKDVFDRFQPHERFIATPRDLATYVHYDALYQAYLNACLIMLGGGQPLDAGLPEGAMDQQRDGFATYGGPHILTLVTEVATRALKAVRRQKYNIHLRARPEALAAAVSLAWSGGEAKASLGHQAHPLGTMADQLDAAGMLDSVCALNAERNAFWEGQYGGVDHGPLSPETNALLPMAFPEGSPMHPTYGAGHATVAGACVTMLKAFFEMFETQGNEGGIALYDIVDRDTGYPGSFPAGLFHAERLLTGPGAMLDHAYEPDPERDHTRLRAVDTPDLSVQGELDKLAANISIGRNFAGVHFYTDYYESLRMGERIAVGILQEQMLTYREPVSMRFTSFDGDRIMIAGTGGSRGRNDALVFVWDNTGHGGDRAAFETWWRKHQVV